jgi:hypothetical protein
MDLGQGAFSVEQRDDVEDGDGEEDDVLGESGWVAETDKPLAFLVDRKRLERPETRSILAGHRDP